MYRYRWHVCLHWQIVLSIFNREPSRYLLSLFSPCLRGSQKWISEHVQTFWKYNRSPWGNRYREYTVRIRSRLEFYVIFHNGVAAVAAATAAAATYFVRPSLASASFNLNHWFGECFPHLPHTKYIIRRNATKHKRHTKQMVVSKIDTMALPSHSFARSVQAILLYSFSRCHRDDSMYSQFTYAGTESVWESSQTRLHRVKWNGARTASQRVEVVTMPPTTTTTIEIEKIVETSVEHDPEKHKLRDTRQ